MPLKRIKKERSVRNKKKKDKEIHVIAIVIEM